MFKRLYLQLSAAFFVSMSVSVVSVQASDSQGALALTIENDLYSSGTDRHYTNGVQLSYTSDTYHPKWFERLAKKVPWYTAQENTRFGFTLGQAIFTPKDITITTDQPDERPYAGWLYLSMSLFSDSTERLYDEVLIDTNFYRYSNAFELTIGMVGPSSKAEQAQKTVHTWIDSPQPKGWQYQLKDELGINLAYTRQWQVPLYSRYIDVTPQIGMSLGNVYTYANAGMIFRFGNNLSKDFGPPLIRPSGIGSRYFEPRDQLEYYFFAGFNGRYVARNIFLDGNTSKDGPSVNKENWVGDAQIGFVVNYGDIQLSITDIFRTREFKGQDETDEFGSINFVYRL